jgi:hypothetical protein
MESDSLSIGSVCLLAGWAKRICMGHLEWLDDGAGYNLVPSRSLRQSCDGVRLHDLGQPDAGLHDARGIEPRYHAPLSMKDRCGG